MDIKIVKVKNDERVILKNLLELYCYEWSQYTNHDVNQMGSYEFAAIDCWTKEDHHAFLIKVNDKFAGFVLVDKDFDYRSDSDFAISEFFVMHKYRKTGVGRYAINTIFDDFQGKWEIRVHPKNLTSVCFWDKIIEEYTNGIFEIIRSCPEFSYQDGTLADFYLLET